jgi:uncharacterized protein
LQIKGVIWLRQFVDKLAEKHEVSRREVESLFKNRPRFRKIGRGDVAGEDLYTAMGRTEFGRYLIVFFIYKRSQEALVISAREMTTKERKQHGKK